jgi:hypothetical protein
LSVPVVGSSEVAVNVVNFEQVVSFGLINVRNPSGVTAPWCYSYELYRLLHYGKVRLVGLKHRKRQRAVHVLMLVAG